MIYLDSSVALAQILTEARRPLTTFWDTKIFSSRLLQYEVWNRLHARGANAYRHQRARLVFKRAEFVEMTPEILERGLRPFPVAVRTLDSLHLATMDYLRTRGVTLSLASHDMRLLSAAEAMGFGTVAI